jgi:hypothetical protein
MSREATIERERRWAPIAAVACFAALALLIGSLISRAQIPTSSNSGVQLANFDAHPGALVFSSVLSAAGFALFSIPLAFLFTAARVRSPRVQPALIALCFIGPVLIGAQGLVNGLGLKSASHEYVSQRPAEQTKPLSTLLADLNAKPPRVDKVNVYTDANQFEVQLNDDTFYAVSYPEAREKQLIGSTDQGNASASSSVTASSEIGKAADKAGADISVDSGGKVGDALASHIADDNSTVKLGSDLLFPAALAMIGAMVYTALQAYRVGLLTRFFGTLGMALGAALILLPQAPVLVALWLGWLGLIFLGRTPGGRPPAWDAGEAVPWPTPGQRGAGDGEAPIEGQATEVGAAGEANPPRQPGERRKRKRRR